MKKWYWCLLFVVLAPVCGDEIALVPVPEDPANMTQSIECESLEVQLSDANWDIDQCRQQIARKQSHIARIERMLAQEVFLQQQYINNGEPTPPGVIDAINVYRLWLRNLDRDVAALRASLSHFATRNNELWAMFVLAGC